ncbi:Carboxypeptidase S [Nakaseomyces bracarensis]|uniref:Carboxypeptidase S n=1 Tax=Nakaseomyces bracarensis TaxID=273131 RepID=A0ABR4NTV0_9SACH
MEKETVTRTKSKGILRKIVRRTMVLSTVVYLVYLFSSHLSQKTDSVFTPLTSDSCPSTEPLVPAFNHSLDTILHDPVYKRLSIKRLSDSVKIPTVVQDTNPDPKEDIDFYKHFFELHDYLKETFPRVHEHLKLEKVNEVGLLYTWEGSDESLKPLLFMAHQDVVPVNNETLDQWTFPPFEGQYDSENDFVWGRGSNDCKNLLIAQFEAVEKLLEDGFKPKRTVLFSHGFDEEAGGEWGAFYLAKHIEKKYGKDGIYAIIDEGEGLVEIDQNTYIAAPINAEKGYVDVLVTVNGKGGHSSVPPDHTTIGVAAKLISLLEFYTSPFQMTLDNPLYGTLNCAAEHSTKMDSAFRRTIRAAKKCKFALWRLTKMISEIPMMRDLIRTTTAVDIINGGVKANALPETTSFLVNHRIDLHSTIEDTVQKDIRQILKVAKKFGYGVTRENKEVILEKTTLGYIDISIRKGLEPAPRSPSSGAEWDLLAGTVTDLFQNRVFKEQQSSVYVTTGLFSGNTDTKHYWSLSNNIYRFIGSIIDPKLAETLHSINEHVDMPGHLSAIGFIYEYILNVDHYGN